MLGAIFKAAVAVSVLLGTLLMFAAQVPPSAAEKSLVEWVDRLGLVEAAKWLGNYPADEWGTIFAAALIVAPLSTWLIVWRWHRKQLSRAHSGTEAAERCNVFPRNVSEQRKMVRLEDALRWVIKVSDWEPGMSPDSHLGLAATEMRQAAKDQEIIIRGRREINRSMPGDNFDQTWDDIPANYWQTHEFELTNVVSGGWAQRETRVLSAGDLMSESMPHYAMLRLREDELKARWPEPKFIPLKEAATIAYESTLNTLVAGVAERMTKDPEGTLSYYAHALTQDPPVPLFGTRPPSRKLEAIPANKVRACRFGHDLKTLESHRLEYAGLVVRECDLMRKIREIQSWSGAITDD